MLNDESFNFKNLRNEINIWSNITSDLLDLSAVKQNKSIKIYINKN